VHLSLCGIFIHALFARVDRADGDACEGGSIIFPILKMNLRGESTPEGLEEFVTVAWDFYHDLGSYYHALIDAWIDERAP
jgi:hypothetical protein